MGKRFFFLAAAFLGTFLLVSSASAETQVIDADFLLSPGLHIDIVAATRDADGRLLMRDKYSNQNVHEFSWSFQEKVTMPEFIRLRHPNDEILKILWRPVHGTDYLGDVFIIYRPFR